MDIAEYVLQEYGSHEGQEINAAQKLRLTELAAGAGSRSVNQQKTLTNTILPRVALYEVLLERGFTKAEAHSAIKKYMDSCVGAEMNRSLRKLEALPGFFSIFRRKMCSEVSGNDNWKVTIVRNRPDEIAYNIERCLWHEACVENGCAELCPVFCDADNVIYGNMRKVDFRRNGTIGKGAPVCDFRFARKGIRGIL